MRNIPRLRFLKEAGDNHHTHDTTELRIWNACKIGNVLERNTATQGYTCQDLEFTQPVQTSEQLILQYSSQLHISIKERTGARVTYMHGKLLEKIRRLSQQCRKLGYIGHNGPTRPMSLTGRFWRDQRSRSTFGRGISWSLDVPTIFYKAFNRGGDFVDMSLELGETRHHRRDTVTSSNSIGALARAQPGRTAPLKPVTVVPAPGQGKTDNANFCVSLRKLINLGAHKTVISGLYVSKAPEARRRVYLVKSGRQHCFAV